MVIKTLSKEWAACTLYSEQKDKSVYFAFVAP